MSWSCIALSIIGNAGQHGMVAYGLVPPWWVIVVVSAVPPALFGAVVHLAVLVGQNIPDRSADQSDQQAGGSTPEPDQPDRQGNGDGFPAADWTETAPIAPLPWRDPDRAGPKPDHTGQRPVTSSSRDAEIVADLREWAVDEGRPISRDRVMRGYGIGATRARRLRDGLN